MKTMPPRAQAAHEFNDALRRHEQAQGGRSERLAAEAAREFHGAERRFKQAPPTPPSEASFCEGV